MNPEKLLPWHAMAARVIPRHKALKAFGTMIFIAVFFGAYFYLLKNPASTPHVMPLIWLDKLVPFQPHAFTIYVSLWFYVSLPPILLSTRHELYQYGTAIALTCLTGLVVFYFWPTAVPSPDINWSLYPGMEFLKNVDASGNACPSLHVATALFSGMWLHHLLRRIGSPAWLLGVNAVWCAGIIYATLATRQHVAIDVAAGVLLGGLAAILSLRIARRTIYPAILPFPLQSH